MKLQSAKPYKTPIALKGLELLLDITFLIDPYQHALLKRLKDHIDINYVLATEKVEKEQSCTEELSDTKSGFVGIGFVGIGFVGIVAGPTA